MTDEEFRDLADEVPEILDCVFSAEHAAQDEPAETVLMHRRHQHYTEVLWIRAYRGARMIVLTFPPLDTATGIGAHLPGCIREVPLGVIASAQVLTAYVQREVRQHLQAGWEMKSASARYGSTQDEDRHGDSREGGHR